MLFEKLHKRIRKFMRRVKHKLFGPSISEMLSLSRSNRDFKKEQERKKREALEKLIVECSKIKPDVCRKSHRTRNRDDSNSIYDESKSSENRDDSGSQAYQTGQLF